MRNCQLGYSDIISENKRILIELSNPRNAGHIQPAG